LDLVFNQTGKLSDPLNFFSSLSATYAVIPQTPGSTFTEHDDKARSGSDYYGLVSRSAVQKVPRRLNLSASLTLHDSRISLDQQAHVSVDSGFPDHLGPSSSRRATHDPMLSEPKTSIAITLSGMPQEVRYQIYDELLKSTHHVVEISKAQPCLQRLEVAFDAESAQSYTSLMSINHHFREELKSHMLHRCASGVFWLIVGQNLTSLPDLPWNALDRQLRVRVVIGHPFVRRMYGSLQHTCKLSRSII